MNRIDRLFGILTYLQSRKFVPTEKIAEKFDISVRTVYRDIKHFANRVFLLALNRIKATLWSRAISFRRIF